MQTSLHSSMTDSARRQVAAWLMLCCAMIFAMVILGGVTRLTGSGLSMVEWDPLFGFIPPLNETAWQEVFAKYRTSPEYQKVNVNMDLHGFKSIYWFEFGHRVLGRTIGMVFLLPFLYFLLRGMLSRPLIPRLAFAFVLGGLQGVLGWYMVKSGLVDRPHVSQYRLAAHLGLALAIYAWLLWLLFDLLFPDRRPPGAPASTRRFAAGLLLMSAITIASGAFVAGLKAGHAWNTFPKMGDQWLPPGGWSMQPGWRNFFDNIATVQFDHRVLAISTLVLVILFWISTQGRNLSLSAKTGIHLLPVMVMVQVALGISTLLLLVPVPLAATHQAGALVLLSIVLFVNHRLQNS